MPPAPTGRTLRSGRQGWPSVLPVLRGSRMRGKRVPPTARRQWVWCVVLRDPDLGAGSGCGAVGRATAGPGGRTGLRASGGVCPSAPPPHLHKCKAALRWPGRQGRPSASLGQGRAGYVKGVDCQRRGGSGCGVGRSVTRAWEPGSDAGLRAALLRARMVERGCGLQAACVRLPPPSFT